jgi:hypothetical protein
MKRTAIFLGFFLMLACQNGNSQPKAADDTKPANLGKYYHVKATPDEVKAGEEARVVVELSPGSGYKWNDEYPTKFSLTAPEGLTLGKEAFSAKKKEVEISTRAASISVPVTFKEAGSLAIKFKGSFSVCNETSCKIMRNEEFSVKVTGK